MPTEALNIPVRGGNTTTEESAYAAVSNSFGGNSYPAN